MIAVKFNAMESCCRDLRTQKTQLEKYKNDLIRIRRKLPLAVCISSNIDENLGNLAERLGKISNQCNRLTSGLEESLALYRGTENELLGITGSAETAGQTGEEAGGGPSFDWFKLFGGAGIAGGVASTVAGIVRGTDPWFLTGAKIVKQLFGTAKEVVKVSSGDTTWAEALFGIGNAAEDISKGSGNILSQVFKKELGKYKGNGTTAGSLGAIAKWAGVVVTGITAGVSNYKEYKSGEITAGRAVAETVGETAVNVGVDLALTAGITAALAAAVGGAPAIVVAGGVYLTKLGLDAVCEHFFQKDVAELVSDAVLDAGEWVVDKASQMVDAVGDAARGAVEYVSKGIGKAVDAVAGAGRWIGARWRHAIFG